MSAEWPMIPLGELTVNLDARRKPVKEADRKPGPYPYYGASGIVDYVEGYLFEGDHLLIAEDGENLRTRQLPIAFMASGKFWVNNHAHIVVGNEKADTRFLMYALQNADVSGFLTGAVMPKLTQGNLNRIPLPCPTIEIQRNIARILGDLDDKIELNRQINQTLEQIAQAIFKSWFVDFEPVKAKIEAKAAGSDPERAAMCAISGKLEPELDQLSLEQYQRLAATAALFPDELVESELGLIPKGWGVVPLYDTADYVNGSAFKSEDFSEDGSGLPIVKIAELKQGITSQTKFTTKMFKDKYAIKSGDMLYSWSGSPETSLEVFKWFGGSGWLNQHIFKLNFSSIEQHYLTYYLLKHLKPLLVQTAMDKQTTGLGHVTVADMKRIKVAYPETRVLEAFSGAVSALYEQDSQLCEQIVMLNTLRDTLLPKLLSGELRPIAEED